MKTSNAARPSGSFQSGARRRTSPCRHTATQGGAAGAGAGAVHRGNHCFAGSPSEKCKLHERQLSGEWVHTLQDSIEEIRVCAPVQICIRGAYFLSLEANYEKVSPKKSGTGPRDRPAVLRTLLPPYQPLYSLVVYGQRLVELVVVEMARFFSPTFRLLGLSCYLLRGGNRDMLQPSEKQR